MYLSKKALALAAASAFGALAFVSTASAQEASCWDSANGCYSGSGYGSQLNVGGGVNFGAYGGGIFEGDSGGVNVYESGEGSTYTNLEVSGNGCEIDCTDLSIDFGGYASQNVQTDGFAHGSHSGNQVTLVTEGGAFSGAGFTFERIDYTGGTASTE